mmetsp:Transcript_38988/g.90371  ORF Transcript_38988/g.90371 Transcript_38988/m.90371 type:complete len:118 (+) Transcript_38988:101-454(+)
MAGELWKVLVSIHVIPVLCCLVALLLYFLRKLPGVLGTTAHLLLIFPIGCATVFVSYALFFALRFKFAEKTMVVCEQRRLPLAEAAVAIAMFVAHLIVQSLPPRSGWAGFTKEEKVE